MTSMTNNPMTSEDLKIINELKKMPDGAQIALDGPLGFLYSHIGGEGETIVINNGKTLQVIYIDHDDVITSIQPDNAKFAVFRQDDTLMINVVLPYSDNVISLHFSFDLRTQSALNALDIISSRKKINMNFISIEYGNLVKSFHAPLAIPKEIIRQF